jgi:ribose 5-phosphate isomerase A
MPDLERYKRQVGEAAAALIESGSVVGLGSGSTSRYAIEALGQALATGARRDVRGVPTSRRTEHLAQSLGIPLVELPAEGVDLAIDGADEIGPELDAIKGLGGALTREKVVAAAARRFVLVADGTKRVRRLGERAPVPVEVLRFGWHRTRARLAALGCEPRLRCRDAEPFVTDNGHVVFDCAVDPETFDAVAFAAAVDALPGVVGHGLFLGLAHEALLADASGVLSLRRDQAGP